MITQNRLKELLLYRPETGVFTWVRPQSNRVKLGAAAHSVGSGGYLRLGVDGERYLAHRLAWLYVYGQMPDSEIDHINQNKTDNRIVNLRLATRRENAQNVKTRATNKSGAKGVSWDVDRKKWRAQINIDGKRKYLGLFSTVQDAAEAYNLMATTHHTHRSAP